MYLKSLKKMYLEILNISRISLASSYKAEVKLELLTDVDMLLMFEKRINCGKCNSIINRFMI